MDISTPREILARLLSIFPTDFVADPDYSKYLQYIPIFLLGFLIAMVVTPIIGHIALKYDITYKPGVSRKGKVYDNQEKALHEGITPSLGGLAITIPALIAIIFFFRLDSFTLPIIVATLILIVGSALDDILNLPAKTQLLYQILASIIIAFSVINLTDLSLFNLNLDMYTWNFSVLGMAQSLVFPGDIFLILWIVTCINAYKWTAGSPGIIEGNSFIIFLLIFIIGIRYQSVFSSTISILMAGGLLLFLIFALPPQKIMTGSAGKSVYGFMICTLAIIADTKLSTTIMLLMMPLIDLVYVVIKRYLVYKPKNLVELMKINGADHFHHQLIKLGLRRRSIVLIESAITLFLGSFAILTAGAKRYFALIFVSALAIAIVVTINIYASKKKEKPTKEKSPESKYSY